MLAAALALAPAAGAALVYDKGFTSGHPSVWIANDDGSGARRLAPGNSPHISPDGLTVVYELMPTAATGFKPWLMKIPASGGTPTLLRKPVWLASGFAWSPDSHTIATVTGREIGTKRLVLLDVATGATRTVASGAFSGVSFSPTGTAIAYARASRDGFPLRSEVYTAPVAGGTPTPITTGRRSIGPVWGATSIVISRQRKSHKRGDGPKQDLYTVRPDGTRLHRLTRTNVPFLLTGLTATEFSADGTRLLAEFGGQDTSFAETVSPSSGRQHTVGRLADGIVGYRLSSDGRSILAATGGYDPAGRHDVVSIPYVGGVLTVLARHAYDPDWTR